MEQKLPTLKQLERTLSQKIQKLYHNELNHFPQKVTCKIFGDRLAIAIEDGFTIMEQTLIKEDDSTQIVKDLNIAINKIIKLKLKTSIEAVLAVQVKEILFNSKIETQLTGAIAILERAPKVRSSKSILKLQKYRYQDEDNCAQVDDESLTTSIELQKQENVGSSELTIDAG